MTSHSHTLGRGRFLDRVAAAPISWGVCEVPGWGRQLAPERVLAEMSELGFRATELGSAGWLPADITHLRSLLRSHRLDLLGGFVPLVMHRPDELAAAREDAEATARLLSAAGARFFNTAPVTSTDWCPRRPLTDDEWRHLMATIDLVDQICDSYGLVQVLHQHVGCVIETAAEVQRVLDHSSVRFVLDTGHLAIGGVDPVRFATDHVDRVGLVHLKDTRLDVARRLNNNELTLMEAVKEGLFPPLGNGDLDVKAVVQRLEAHHYDGWYVLEQDCAIAGAEPQAGFGPIRDVETSVDYLQHLADHLNQAGN